MGQQEAPDETDEAETATGAVDSPWPASRSIGPPHLHLRRHHGWQIETTFQEARSYLGLETPRGWCQKTVLRAAPCLLGLYSVVALLYAELPAVVKEDWQVVWLGKEPRTFSDAVTAVRRWLWTDWVFASRGHNRAFNKLPLELQETLLSALAPAA